MRGRKSIILLVLLLLLPGVAIWWWAAWLPDIAAGRVADLFARATGGVALRLEVRSIRPRGADLAAISMGDAAAPFLQLDSLRLDYSPSSLLDGRIDGVAVTGLTLRCRLENGTLVIPGLDWRRLAVERQTDATENDASSVPPLQRLVIREGVLLLSRGPATMRLPFDLHLTFGTGDRGLHGTLQLRPSAAEIEVRGRFSPVKRRLHLNLAAEAASLQEVLRAVDPEAGPLPAGSLSLQGEAEIDTLSQQVVSGQLRGESTGFDLRVGEVRLHGTPSDEPAGRRPVRVRLQGGGDIWRLEATDLAISTPGAAIHAELDTELRLKEEAVHFFSRGSLLFSASEAKATSSEEPQVATTSHPAAVTVRAEGWAQRDGDWGTDLTARLSEEESEGGRLEQRLGDMVLALDTPVLTATARGGPGPAGEITWEARVQKAGIKGDGLEAMLAEPVLTGHGTLRRKQNGHGAFWRLGGNFQAASFSAMAADFELGVPGPRLEYTAGPGDNGTAPIDFQATLEFQDGKAEGGEMELAATGISASLPLLWSPEGTTAPPARPGVVRIAGLRWRQLDLGPVAVDLRQHGRSVVFSGRHDSLFLPGVRLVAEGKAVMDEDDGLRADLRLNIPETSFAPVDIGRLDDSMAGVELAGNLGLTGTVAVSGGDLSGSLDLHFADGRINRPDQEFTIEGVALDLRLPALPMVRSAPRQPFSFTSLSFGELQFGAAAVDYQLEASRSLFIEQGGAAWSEGRVSLHSIRIEPEQRQYAFTLYCDRLKLAAILEQFGIEGVEGDGTVNGLIPVRIDRGKIEFDNGYLYSSPGDGGRIRVQGTDILTAGIPPDLPQASQIEFASQALKGFEYNWAKLTFNTEGDELVMGLQLDGEPEEVLPFRYRRGSNVFELLQPGESGGIKQPILLDVNFRLPLNEILGYGKGISQFMEKLRQ